MSKPTTVFKFVSLRPVEQADPKRQEVRLLRPPSAQPATEFQKSLAAAANLEAARKVAKGFIGSEQYISGYGSRDPRMALVREAWRVIKTAAGAQDLGGVRESLKELLKRAAGGVKGG